MSNNGKDVAFEPAELAPHSQDAEEAVLGSILINPDAYLDVVGFLKPDDFFILRNSWIWGAMIRLGERNEAVEYLAVIEKLRTQERLDDVGGAAYITHLASNIGTSVHAEAYGHIVERAAIRRRGLAAASEITRLMREEDAEIGKVLALAYEALDGAVAHRAEADWVHVKQIASEYFDKVERLYQGDDTGIGISTGLKDLDAVLRGFHPGRLYIIGGRPGMWKTWLMIWCAVQAAMQGKRVGIVSMEMNRDEIVNRIIGLLSGIKLVGKLNKEHLRLNPEDVESGNLTESQWSHFVECFGEFEEMDIFIDDSGFQTPAGLKWRARRLKARHSCDILFVDYLQLAHGDHDRQTEYERVTAMSKTLAGLSKPDALNIPVVAVAQLNRDVEQRSDKHPQLSDLRSSGQIEQDASVIMFVYRDIVYNETTETPNIFEIGIKKNRHYGGKKRKGTGAVLLYHDLDNPFFANLKKTEINLENF